MWIRQLSIGIGGVIVGAGMLYWTIRPNPEQKLAHPAPVVTVQANPTVSTPSLGPIEQRLARLERAAQSSTATPPAEVAQAQPRQRPTREESVRAVQAVRERELKAFDSEAYDPSWSSTATAAFRTDLTELAKDKHYRIANIDCKTTMCRATVEWPSYAELPTSVGEILTAQYQNNCTKQVFAPPPADPTQAYAATVIYDCTAARAGG